MNQPLSYLRITKGNEIMKKTKYGVFIIIEVNSLTINYVFDKYVFVDLIDNKKQYNCNCNS